MPRKRNFAICAGVVLCLIGNRSIAQEVKASFHHIHLNAMDPAKSIEYYKKFFGGVQTRFRGVADAVLTDRSFLLFT